uniref:Uncharacterized protein n=1 Tax=Ciona savignyi TaxID=51511 RepID=H2YJ54_CIOSA
MYGASYFTLQYIPHLSYNVSSAISGTKFTPRASAALDATTTVLLHLVPYWTDQILMDQLSRLSKEIILPLIGVLASKKFSFPYGGTQRKALCLKTVKVVVTIAVRIGRDMARQRMTGILQSFFSNYTTPIQNGRNGLVNDGGNTISPKETSITIPRSLEPATDSITAAIHSTRLNDSWMSDSSNSMNGSTESVNISSNSSKDKSLVNTENDEKIIAEISETFCPETAYHAYVPFTRLMGGFHM